MRDEDDFLGVGGGVEGYGEFGGGFGFGSCELEVDGGGEAGKLGELELDGRNFDSEGHAEEGYR